MANVLFYIRTNSPTEVERHLVESLNENEWEWAVGLYPTSAQVVHDSMEVKDSAEPNWHCWYSYIPYEELYGSTLGPNFLKALFVLNGVNELIECLLISDTNTGDAGEKLCGEALEIYQSGTASQPGKE